MKLLKQISAFFDQDRRKKQKEFQATFTKSFERARLAARLNLPKRR
jgi:hypothetical protein